MNTEEIAFPGAGVRLSGSVTCPDAADACPGVVLIGGSGPSDRHNDGFFDVLRAHLVSVGVAVLAYDKRGAGKSTGTWAEATVEDLAHDAAGAVTALQAHPRVAADAVGVLGHSEGGWVALRLCARLSTPRHLIVNSCPAVSFAESEVYTLTAAGAQHGAAAALLEQLTAAARAGRSYQQGQQIIAACQHEPWYPLLSAEGFTLDPGTWAQLTAWADYDPYDDLTRLKTPTLAIFGENDPLVPVRVSIDRYQQTAASAGRYQQTVVFPGAGHRLQVTAGGFAPGYLTQVSTWCHDQATTPSAEIQVQRGVPQLTAAWSPDELERIGAAEELQITPIRADGTRRREVPIWVVCANGQVYVRTWWRRDHGWFGHVVNSRRAHIRVPGLEADAAVADIGADKAEVRAAVDAAYRAKYGRYGETSVAQMVTDDAAATTLRLVPEPSSRA